MLVAVGRLRERHFREAADEYLKRLTPYAKVREAEVADRDLSRDQGRALADEAADILRAIPESSYMVLLDRTGAERSSEELARWLDSLATSGRSDIVFVIGGASGVTDAVAARADERLSFGPITLPHQLARVVLLEQLYRAFRINRNEPYHR